MDPNNNPLLEKYFESNILNRNFKVSLAKDSTTDLTTNYNGYDFMLLKTDLYHGPLKAITLPDSPSEFKF